MKLIKKFFILLILTSCFLSGCHSNHKQNDDYDSTDAVQSETIEANETKKMKILSEPSKDVTLKKNICYQKSEGDKCYMDVAYRKNGKKKPLMLCVHGGSWKSGSKETMNNFLYTFSDYGYVVASIDYDVLPDATIVEQEECIEKALEYIIRKANIYEIDSQKIILLGSSSGAQLVLRFTEEVVENQTNYNFHINSVVDLFAPADLNYYLEVNAMSEDAKEQLAVSIDGKTNSDIVTELKKIDVMQNVSKKLPSILILHGREDTVVPISISETFYKRLQEEGVSSKFVAISEMKHEIYSEKVFPEIRQFLGEEIK